MCVLLVAAGLTAGVFWIKDRTIVLPDWARAIVETRIADAIPEARVTFGEMVLIMDEGWRPRARVRDVRAVSPEGVEIVSFSELRASMSLSGLMEQRLQLKSLDLNGVFVTLRRSPEGRIALQGGIGTASVAREAPNLAQLIAEMDDFLLRPMLARLTRATLQGLTLQYEDDRADRAWTIDGGRITVNREGADVQMSVDLAVLGGGDQVATVAANYAGRIGQTASEFGVTFAHVPAGDIAVQGQAFAWLEVLDAPISGSLRGGVNEDSSIRPLNATMQIGAGVIQPTDNSRPIPIDSARSYFSYQPSDKLMRFNELSVQSKWVSGRLEGSAVLKGGGTQRLVDLVGQFRLSNLQINPADFYEEPVSVAEAELDFRLSLRPFLLEVGRLQVIDQGKRLTAQGRLGADANGWDIALDAEMDALETERLMALWPQALKPKTRTWLSENVFAGQMRDATAALRWTAGQAPDTYLGFDFVGADVRFLKEMPLIKGGKGHASLLRDRFVLVVDEGKVQAPEGGAVTVTGSSFIIPDVTAKEGTPAVVRLLTSSTVTAALSMLDQPPLKVMTKAALPVSIAEGWASLAGTLALPLKKKTKVDEVEFDVSGRIDGVRSDVLVKNYVLNAPTLTLAASESAVSLEGQGDLSGVPFDIVWAQPLGVPGTPGHVTGQVELTPEALDVFKVALPDGYVTGRGTADIDIELIKDTPPDLQLRSDLRGIGLSIAPLGWSKAPATPGKLLVRAQLSEVPTVEGVSLEAPGLNAKGAVLLTENGKLDRVSLTRVQIASWLDAPVDLVGRGAGRPLGIVVRGGRFDLRRADLPAGSVAGAEPAPLSVSLDSLQVTDTVAITGLRGEFTTGAGLDGTFSGRINGGAPVTGRVIPQGARSAIRLTANDAGAVFSSAGVMQQGRGGKLELVLLPVGTGGAFDGTLRVLDTSIVDAPAMAALLNAVSIVGLFNVEGGDSLYFTEVNADFRLSPARITLREGSAVGSSMGISMDGVLATDTGQLQMQGVITPVYLLNGIGSIFTRKGEGLFAFNYSITGTTKDPDVFVNPLTALTPGGIRDLFRAPKPDVPLVEGETPPPPPPPSEPRTFTRGEDR
ncbi:YhdP family protein [Roseobacter insulae]|uniref:YhdP family protein n=1 Tax=Roseobacter insulae TaxID=2859783 RepID=UPI0027E44810|nr:DUF3971 domain-containing protein [Roseobacter insulae]